jgi:hypothetical protein
LSFSLLSVIPAIFFLLLSRLPTHILIPLASPPVSQSPTTIVIVPRAVSLSSPLRCSNIDPVVLLVCSAVFPLPPPPKLIFYFFPFLPTPSGHPYTLTRPLLPQVRLVAVDLSVPVGITVELLGGRRLGSTKITFLSFPMSLSTCLCAFLCL